MGRQLRRFRKQITAILYDRYLKLFPEPAEVRLLEILGGSTITLGGIKREGTPLTIIMSKGRLLRSEKFQRVAMDNKHILYMNDVNQVIAIQGYDYQRDVVSYFDEEESLEAQGFRVRYVPQSWIEKNPTQAADFVRQFIYA